VEAGGLVKIRDVTLSYRRFGRGQPVLLLPPAAARAGLWKVHQVPALCRAGYEVITMDHRGTPPSSVPPGPYRVADLVADTAGLIRALDLGPCRVVGASLGAQVAQELALARPDLVRAVALLGTRGRMTHLLRVLTRATADVVRAGARVPARYSAVTGIVQLFAPQTLTDDRFAADWLQLAEAFPVRGEGPAAQYEAAALVEERLDALAGITVPTLVVSFAQDVITPAGLGREVADAIVGSSYVELPDTGHFGFLERPDEVNRVLVEYFDKAG
jgi:pimeloyl-ACP methyl ester carboxylesterase